MCTFDNDAVPDPDPQLELFSTQTEYEAVPTAYGEHASHAVLSRSGCVFAVAGEGAVGVYRSCGRNVERAHGMQTNFGCRTTSVCGDADYVVAAGANGAVLMWHFSINTDAAEDLDRIFN